MMMSCSNHSSIQQKSMNSENPSGAGGSRKTGLKPPEQALNCPRCDSPNTKFCYYNNYSLTQPRHFCKTCRRYWTKGGALRNVPIGGGCRKSKKIRSSSSRLSSDSRDSPASSDNGTSHHGLNFFHVPSHQSSMEFQLGSGGGSGSASGINPFSSRNGIFSNPFLTYGDISSTPPPPPPVINPSCFDIDGSASSGSLMGFNFTGSSLSPSASAFNGGGGGGGGEGILQDMGTSAVVNIQSSNNIASSIESLSCLNQDLHWKLQQQRLGMIFGGSGGGVGGDQISTQNHHHHHHHYKGRNISSSVVVGGHHHDLHGIQTEKPQPILFGNLEISKQEEEEEEEEGKKAAAAACTTTTTATTTEWFFEQPYNTPRNTTTTNNIINSGGGGGGGGGQGNENTTTASSPWINGSIHHQAWINSTGLNHHHHHHQYSSALPHE